MHYTINDYIIESELSAKPTSQTNKYLVDIINKLPNNYQVLDYGCGKLRYSIPLAKRVKTVVAVDSSFQIDKPQKINTFYGPPRDYELDGLKVCDISSDSWKKEKYDAVFCINVMSAIPYDNERFTIIQNSKEILKPHGFLLIAVQYRNSYFNAYKVRNDTKAYHDGWLIKRAKNKFSFYGMPKSEYISNLCYKAGFKSIKIKRHDGSYYIWAFTN